jgi:hypothetical protein
MLDQLHNDRLYGSYLNMTFDDIYPSIDEFKTDARGLAAKLIPADFTDDSLEVLYYLLLSRYANNSIASSDVNRFKLQLFSLVFQFGGTWQKKVELQSSIRKLTLEKARIGNRQIDNHAANPAFPPSTASLEEIQYIDAQNSRGYKKGELETLAQISSLLEKDVTEEFLGRFKRLFLWVVSPQRPLWYQTNPEDYTVITNDIL